MQTKELTDAFNRLWLESNRNFSDQTFAAEMTSLALFSFPDMPPDPSGRGTFSIHNATQFFLAAARFTPDLINETIVGHLCNLYHLCMRGNKTDY